MSERLSNEKLEDERRWLVRERMASIHNPLAVSLIEELLELRAALAPQPPASPPHEGEMRDLLLEVRDKGLIYWEPQTTRGSLAKADMLARIDAALAHDGERGRPG